MPTPEAPVAPEQPLPKVIAVMGPTASGKTDLALALAERFATDIVSVDSALVYRGMDIGSAKPSPAERSRIPHHLIDICDPATPYNAADFARDARVCIDAIHARGKIPVLVGGTMLYFKALAEGLSPMPGSDAAIRASIEAEAAQRGWPALHAELRAVDPVSAERLHPNHSQRIGRALEVFRISGRPLSAWQTGPAPGAAADYRWVNLALAPHRRETLHERIAQRFDQMLAAGLIEEVDGFFRRGDLHDGLPSMRAVGYRQVWQYLAGEIDDVAMRERALAATRQLAKRQFTWLRSWPDLNWVVTTAEDNGPRPLSEILKEVLNIEGIRAI